MLTTLKLGWQKAILPIQNIFMPQLEFCAISVGEVGEYIFMSPNAMHSAGAPGHTWHWDKTTVLWGNIPGTVTGWGPGLSAK